LVSARRLASCGHALKGGSFNRLILANHLKAQWFESRRISITKPAGVLLPLGKHRRNGALCCGAASKVVARRVIAGGKAFPAEKRMRIYAVPHGEDCDLRPDRVDSEKYILKFTSLKIVARRLMPERWAFG